jgi:hypothetical protein
MIFTGAAADIAAPAADQAPLEEQPAPTDHFAFDFPHGLDSTIGNVAPYH